MTRRQQWHTREQHEEFAQLLRHPLMVEALEILDLEARSLTDTGVVNAMTQGMNSQDAAYRTATVLYDVAGRRQVIDDLKKLARPQAKVEPRKDQEPFEHIKPEYLENRKPAEQ